MKSVDLLLTLGHNSSAIAVYDGQILAGYEEERITRKKSDSRFPENAIYQCMQQAKRNGIEEVDRIYVTHWAVDGRLASMSQKHWRPDLLPHHKKLITHENSGMSHHDTHARAADWYAFGEPGMPRDGTMYLVIDGFGNFGEHISIYRSTGFGPQLVRRMFGYDGSLGLMYQYMTAFLGMKQHEDEYKILGYEAHINEVVVDLGALHRLINNEITRYVDSYFDKKMFAVNDPVIRLDALPNHQKKMVERWEKVCQRLDISSPTSYEARVVLGYFVQAVLEGVVLTLINIYRPTNLICSGGVFYNVKLNRRILDVLPGKLCVYPLAGDQGNALGLYASENELKWPGHLNWGHRPSAYKDLISLNPTPNFTVVPDYSDALEHMQESLKDTGWVNLVRGAMEFGPRALCNTSTIALPQPGIVQEINRANGRNTIMPMAPVMSSSEYKSRMMHTDRIHMSHKHMIVALPYSFRGDRNILGAVHQYEQENTGRPQVLDNDVLMSRLLVDHPVLINTSFNVHGQPIVFDLQSALHSHLIQGSFAPTIYVEAP